MMVLRVVLVLVVLACSVGAECPPGCDGCICFEDQDGLLAVECDDLHGFTLPPCVNDSVDSLVVTGSAVVVLRKEDFLNASSLRKLQISNSPSLSSIEEDTFENAPSLRTLYLINNALTDIPDNVFFGLTNLTHIGLKNNGLLQLSAGLLNGLTSLEILELDGNDISQINDNAFSEAPNLQSLDLSFNSLSSIDENTFQGLESLRSLRLKTNRIATISSDALNMPSLTVLDLEDNSIQDLPVDVFAAVPELSELYLADNQLNELPTSALLQTTSLIHLQLSHNPINVIPTNAFLNLENLESLHIEHMEELDTIEDGAFSGLTSLTQLLLDFCPHLTAFTPGMLQPDEKDELTILQLNNNSISEFSTDLFNNLASLRYVSIGGNPVECSCAAAWMRVMMDAGTPDWVWGWREGQDAVVCQAPNNLRGRRVYEVEVYDLTCEEPVSEERSEIILEDIAIFQVMLKRGMPSTLWEIPDGTTILPVPISTDTVIQQSVYEATEEILSNRSVVATLSIHEVSASTMGTYKLKATNAGGTLELVFDLALPTEAPSGQDGLSAGQTAGVVIGVLLLVVVLAGFGWMFLWKRGQRPYNRFEGGTTEEANADIPVPPEDHGHPKEATKITAESRSYGGTDNPFSAPADNSKSVVI